MGMNQTRNALANKDLHAFIGDKPKSREVEKSKAKARKTFVLPLDLVRKMERFCVDENIYEYQLVQSILEGFFEEQKKKEANR